MLECYHRCKFVHTCGDCPKMEEIVTKALNKKGFKGPLTFKRNMADTRWAGVEQGGKIVAVVMSGYLSIRT